MSDPHFVSAVDPLVGKVLAGRFEVQELIDRGGMGKVYRAIQQPLGRTVALKVLDIIDDGEFRQRFFLEASLSSRLSHPNTVRVFDYGCSEDGVYFISMEFLEGRTLSRLVREEAPIAPERALRIIRRVCGALGEAHERGIVHRDLKPANIFLTRHQEHEDFPKVVDFGLVKDLGTESELSKTGHVLGSPMYIAPEQVNNDEVDHRADIYSTGLILYVLLTGKTPFKKGNALSLLMAQLHREPPPFAEANPDISIDPALEWVVFTAIQKERENRFATMAEFNKALKICLKHMRGELGTPKFEIQDGFLVLPEGMEVSEDMRVSDATTRRLLAKPLSPPKPARPLTAGFFAVIAGLFGMLAIGLVLVGGTLQFHASRTPADPPAPVPQMPDTVEVIPTQPEASAAAKVTLSSEPTGSSVERDGVYLGTTPLTVSMPSGEEWIVELSHPGFTARKVRLAPDQPALSVTLLDMESTEKPVPSSRPRPLQVAPAPDPVSDVQPAPKPSPLPEVRDPWGR